MNTFDPATMPVVLATVIDVPVPLAVTVVSTPCRIPGRT